MILALIELPWNCKLVTAAWGELNDQQMAATIQSTMIRASAGSGKTFQLANRFLALMMLGESPEKIIALTFTRKAAGEFTGRIMTRLADGASSESQADKLAAELKQVIEGTDAIPALVAGSGIVLPKMDASFFQQKLSGLIDVLDRLALSTLDSYFVRIVRNFYLELGLSGFELMEDAAISAERMAVMKVIFSHRKTSKQDRDGFIQSFKQATWGEQENRLCKTLEDFIQMHQDRWLSSPDIDCWGSADQLWLNGCPYPEGDIKELARELRTMMGKPYTPHATYMKGWLKVCDLLEQYQPGVPLNLNTQLKRAIPLWDQYKLGGKVEEKNKYEISPEIGKVMSALVGNYIKAEIEVCIKRTQGLYTLISAYEERYRDHVRNRGKLCFSDLTMLLAGEGALQIWDGDDRNLIDFRLDARYDHWLLDEFQDTSRPQWKAVGNLIDEIMQDAEGGRSVFVVGDSKQSIYGWRGGEPRLFEDLKKHYGDRLADWDMDLSYRSSQPVLDLVNTVCDLSDPKWGAIFPAAAIDRWIYHAHTPHNDGAGHALVIETDIDASASSGEKKEARYRSMVSVIKKVKPLERGMSCAILVSKNAQVTEIVQYLRAEPHCLPVASESETHLADGPIGAVILDLFRWLRNPAHSFGYIHLCSSPLGAVLDELSGSDQQQQQWQWLTDELAQQGVQCLLNRIISMLRECQPISAYGHSRLDEIQAAAADFSSRGGTLNEWVQMLETRSIKETSHEGMIQVMTVHKCKGLGFDMVILPELISSNEFTSSGRVDALERKGEMGDLEYVIKKPNQAICEADEALAKMSDAWSEDQCYERFCNLYVALTRAKKATYCILDPVKGDWEPKAKYDDWIREATAAQGERQEEINDEKCTVLYEAGDWLALDGSVEPLAEAEEPKVSVKLPQASPRMSRKLASETTAYQAGDLLRNSKGMSFGDRVHKQFEQITWLDDLPEFSEAGSSKAVAECLKVPEIRHHFERPKVPFQLLREQPIETQHDDRWVSGVIDRAVVLMDEGKATSISIIDFKTDAKETAESLRTKHTPQLHIYRAALHRITGVPLDEIRCYLLATELRQMVEID